MCDFASFMVRLNKNKLEIKRWDWRSHSVTIAAHDLVITRKEEWSEAEWLKDDPKSLLIRHTDIEKEDQLRAAIVAQYPTRKDLVRAFSGKVTTKNGDFYCADVLGKAHCDDGPAVKKGDYEEWYRHGLLHRIGGPAITSVSKKAWYENGELHRVDGPAAEYITGEKRWYIKGKLHRNNGPALANNYDETWYQEGKIHREDGPATIRKNFFDGKLSLTWSLKDYIGRKGDLPTLIHISPSSIVLSWQNTVGFRQRENGPAHIVYLIGKTKKNNKVVYVTHIEKNWYKKGKIVKTRLSKKFADKYEFPKILGLPKDLTIRPKTLNNLMWMKKYTSDKAQKA